MSASPNLICPKPQRPIPPDSPHRTSISLSSSFPNETPSRTHSFLNLTSSTLRGIYSPRRYDFEQDNVLSPAVASVQAAQTLHPNPPSLYMPNTRHFQTPITLGLRIVLLFGSGMSCGFLIKHLRDEPQLAKSQVKYLFKRDDWVISIFWGVLSTLVGCLLPYLDYLFSSNKHTSMGKSRNLNPLTRENLNTTGGTFDQNWTPVIRSIAAFFGIACAIRKLPWSSTLQASIALSIVNLTLWYLIDHSKTGLILSTIVGVAGTPLLLILNPELIPHPMLVSFSKNRFTANACTNNEYKQSNWAWSETPEASIWILGVLFCSCVCFGNIGRKFALISV